jgi:hypothetical protein
MNIRDAVDPLADDALARRLSSLGIAVPRFRALVGVRPTAVPLSRTRLPRMRQGRVIGGLALAVCAALAISIAAAAASGKIPFNPWAALSDQQKQADVDKTHAENARYLDEFQAKHGDPRSLPVIKISTWAPASASVGAAAAEADLIVHGRVESVNFTSNPTGGMPEMDATVRITDVAKGSAGSTIVVKQSGGPVAQPGGKGALVELEYEHLILPGDEVVLIMRLSPGSTSTYRPIYGPGALIVKNGYFSGDTARRYGLDQRPLATIWKSLIDRSLEPDAFPLQ